MPPEITALVQLIGAPAAIVLVLILRDWYTGKTNAKQDNTITDFAVTFNAERKERQAVIDELQKSNNHLQSEIFNIQLKQAEEAGRREEMRLTNEKQGEKIVILEVRIQELEKHRQQSNERITELENQITELEHKLARANVEIDILQAQKRELENLLIYERNRADTLNNLVTQLRTVDSTPSTANKTVPIPELQAIEADDTYVPPLTPETLPESTEPAQPETKPLDAA